MLEVPSVHVHHPSLVLRRDRLFSIGSNYLTQYLLAVDCDNAKRSPLQ
ncbi:putative PEP-binding protein [Shigella flexneri]